MGKIKSRRGVRAATSTKASIKRPRRNRARAERKALSVQPARPPAAAQAGAPARPAPMTTIDWSATFAPLAQATEPSLWQEMSRPIRRRIARRRHAFSRRARRKLLRARLTVRRTQRSAARAATSIVRPAMQQFEMRRHAILAGTLTALALSIVSAGAFVLYRMADTAPERVVTEPAVPPPKKFTDRVVTPAGIAPAFAPVAAPVAVPAEPPRAETPPAPVVRLPETPPLPDARKADRRKSR